MKDTIVITWDKQIFGEQIEHLRKEVKRVHNQADIVVLNNASTGNAGWATCPPSLPSRTQDAIRLKVEDYFADLRGKTVGKTAAITNYLIEGTREGVNLCQSQGDAWITIERNITMSRASQIGFNPQSPKVRAVFGL